MLSWQVYPAAFEIHKMHTDTSIDERRAYRLALGLTPPLSLLLSTMCCCDLQFFNCELFWLIRDADMHPSFDRPSSNTFDGLSKLDEGWGLACCCFSNVLNESFDTSMDCVRLTSLTWMLDDAAGLNLFESSTLLRERADFSACNISTSNIEERLFASWKRGGNYNMFYKENFEERRPVGESFFKRLGKLSLWDILYLKHNEQRENYELKWANCGFAKQIFPPRRWRSLHPDCSHIHAYQPFPHQKLLRCFENLYTIEIIYKKVFAFDFSTFISQVLNDDELRKRWWHGHVLRSISLPL